ncbi:MAG: sulfur carrier protein ThiS [Dehalococcoidales bacterium]|nr:sulfur carrier protein ThiS [Dehalococcoidales bacterium]
MLIKINGTESEIAGNLTLQSLLSTRKLAISAIIIELNGKIIDRELWGNTKLNPDDSLEVIRMIGGG